MIGWGPLQPLIDSYNCAAQLTKLTREKGEKGEITPLNRKISRGSGPTTEELVKKNKQ